MSAIAARLEEIHKEDISFEETPFEVSRPAPMDPLPTKRERPMSEILGGLNRLMDTAMDADQVRDLIEEHLRARGPRNIVLRVGDWESPVIEGPTPRQFLRVLNLARSRKNIMLVGPAGCGKTTVAAKVAEALGMRFAHLTLTSGMSAGELVGRLLPTGDGGKYEYNISQFVDFYENGGIFLLDEIDAADENTLLAINTALANGSMAVSGRSGAPLAYKSKNFVCIGAANTYGNGADRMYVGRNQLDAATLDRFRVGMVTMDYDAHIEDALVNTELLEWGRTMRLAIKSAGLRRFVSTRFLVDGSDVLRQRTASWAGLMDSYFADWSPDEKGRVGELAPKQPYDPETDFDMFQGDME